MVGRSAASLTPNGPGQMRVNFIQFIGGFISAYNWSNSLVISVNTTCRIENSRIFFDFRSVKELLDDLISLVRASYLCLLILYLEYRALYTSFYLFQSTFSYIP